MSSARMRDFKIDVIPRDNELFLDIEGLIDCWCGYLTIDQAVDLAEGLLQKVEQMRGVAK